MTSILLHVVPLMLAAVAALVLSAVPASANQLNDWKAAFHNHCSTHGLSVSCSDSDEHHVTSDLPDTVVPAGPTVSHGPEWSECGPFTIAIPMPGKHPPFCVADIDSWAFKNAVPGYTIDGGTKTDYTCTTKTGTISLIPLSLTVHESTVAGHC